MYRSVADVCCNYCVEDINMAVAINKGNHDDFVLFLSKCLFVIVETALMI